MKDRYDFSKGKRGAIAPAPQGHTRITIPIDNKVLDWFRDEVHASGGGDYQKLMGHALHEYVQDRKQPLEKILRRVVREELSASRVARKTKKVAA